MILESITRRVSMLAVIALVPSAFAASATMEQLAMEKEGVQLIRQVEEVARDVRYNAGRLTSFTSNLQINKWTHVHHLDQIKSLVNEGLRPAMARLTEIQPQLPDWKQQSDRQDVRVGQSACRRCQRRDSRRRTKQGRRRRP